MDKLYQQSLKWKFDTKYLMKGNKKYTNIFEQENPAFSAQIKGKCLVYKKQPFNGL